MKPKEKKWTRVKEIAEELNHDELLALAQKSMKQNCKTVNKSRGEKPKQ
jgi:hypothetical protein